MIAGRKKTESAPPPRQGSLVPHGAAAGAKHSILFKAPGAQFVPLAGSSQANILSEMHFSRCLSEGSKPPPPPQTSPFPRLPVSLL